MTPARLITLAAAACGASAAAAAPTPDTGVSDAFQWSASRGPALSVGLAAGSAKNGRTARRTPPPEATDIGSITLHTDIVVIENCASAIDSEMAIWNESGALIQTDDDGCGIFNGPSRLAGLNLTPGRYYFAVAGRDTEFAEGFIADVSPDSAGGDYAGTAGWGGFGGSIARGEVDFFTFNVIQGPPVPPPPATDLGAIVGTQDVFSIGTCGSNFWSLVTLWDSDGKVVAFSDSGCGNQGLMTGLSLPVGAYYVTVSGYDADLIGDHFEIYGANEFGDYVGEINDVEISGSIAPGEVAWYRFEVYEGGGCAFTCPPNAVAENEPVCSANYVDDFNGGCGSDTFAFGTLPVGQPFCGTSGTFPRRGTDGSRDIDWFRFTLDDYAWVRISGETSFAYQVGIVDMAFGCDVDNVVVLNGDPCDDFDSGAVFLAPGDYGVIVTTAGFDGVPCGSPYAITLDIEEYVQPSLSSESIGAFTAGEAVLGDTSTSDNTYTFDSLLPVHPDGFWMGPDDVWTYHHPGGPVIFRAEEAAPDAADPDIAVYNDDEQLLGARGFFGPDEVEFLGGLPEGTYHIVIDSWGAFRTGPYRLSATIPVVSDLACGDTTGGPTWILPSNDFTYLLDWNGPIPYAAFRLRAAETGIYDISAVFGENFYGSIFLYDDGFDAASPLAGGLAAGDDPDVGPDERTIIDTVELTAGEVYTAVVTGAWSGDQGSFCLLASGSAAVELVPACVADRNDDGEVNVSDLLSYLGAYRNGDASADVNGQDGITVNDLLAYLGAYRNGC